MATISLRTAVEGNKVEVILKPDEVEELWKSGALAVTVGDGLSSMWRDVVSLKIEVGTDQA